MPDHLYTVDTSSLISGWRFLYPIDVFPGVWDKLGELIDSGVLCASQEVLVELERKEDELHRWVKTRPKMFVPHEESVQRYVREILASHRKLIDTRRGRSGADPFVIAVARWKKCPVVTDEKPSRNPDRKPHIPDVCATYGIKCLSLLELLRLEGVVLRRS